MTVYVDPVIGAAVVHLGLPILPGLPCPTCAGRSEFRDDMFGSSPCPDCTDGVWTPPEHPVPIGVTSAEPVRVGRLGPQGPYVNWRDRRRNQGWGWVLDTKGGARYPIALSSMIGEGTLRPLKVVDFRSRIDGLPGVVEITHGSERRGLRHWFKTTDGIWDWADISSALPFLPGLKPGDTVYLLDGFTQSVECDGGRCGLSHRGCYPGDTSWCSSCDQMIPTERNGRFVTHWHRPMRRSCPFPVDAPDHPCVIVA